MGKENQIQQSDRNYSYGVIDAIVEAMDRVATNPLLAKVFVYDLLQKMPDLVDALMLMTYPEHRPKMAELVKASSRMGAAWVKKERI